MLIVGSDDGAYRLPALREGATAEKVLDADRVERVRTFDAVDGVFAATKSGLYHSRDGEDWTDLDVPRERVYSVGATPSGDRLYAGTKPAHVYVAEPADAAGLGGVDWRELDDFQTLPSREEWRLPRHGNLAQVRDLHVHPDAPDRVVAGVEVGGVHASEDRGETWEERRGGAANGASGDSSGAERSEGLHDDVHELRLASADEWLAATGDGLYRTADAGESWERLDGSVEQRYFRAVFARDGDVYAGAALANSSTWEDDDADPLLCVSRDGGPLEVADLPAAAGTPTGFAAVDGDVVVGTHRGSLFVEDGDGWRRAGAFPTPGEVTGRYSPLAWVES